MNPLESRRTTPLLLLAAGLAWTTAVSSAFGQTTVRTHAGAANLMRFGSAIAGRGDWNGDGVPDVVVGSPGHDAGAGAGQGRIQVLSGASGAELFSANGAAAGGSFGAAVDLSGDIDGDGRADVVAGAPDRNAGAGAAQGEVRVYSASSASPLFVLAGSAAGDRFGQAVAVLGDLDHDGKAEFAVGAPESDGSAGADCGRVTVHSGATGAILYAIEGTGADDRLGTAVAGLADVDGDGVPDFAIGAPRFDGVAGVNCGRVAVHSGATGLEIRSLEGSQAGALSGSSVATAGDFDNDLRGDLVIGAPSFAGTAGAGCGRVAVASGRDGTTLFSVEGTGAGDALGTSVGGGVDVDGDGFDDVVAGAPMHDGPAGTDTGRCSVYRGPDGALLFSTDGSAAGDHDGSAVAGLGDINQDGRAEIATGAPLRDGGGPDRGRVCLIGADVAAGSSAAAVATAPLPRAVAAFDADGDGDRDLVVACAGTVSILWNRGHGGWTFPAEFELTGRTDIALSPGATATSVAAFQSDADAACEIVVGRSDGTVDLVEGTGSGASAAFALSPASPLVVDGGASPGAISSVAVAGTGATAVVVCAAAGTIFSPGFLATVSTPFATPAVSAPLITGGSFTSVVTGDIDGDSQVDIVAANASAGPDGGVHVLLGPGFGPATGSPFPAGTVINDVALADLDGDGTRSDVVASSLSFATGGLRVLPGFGIPGGFGATVDAGLASARAVAAGALDAATGDEVAVLDGSGRLVRLSGWNGTSFASSTVTPTSAAGAVDVAITGLGGGPSASCVPNQVVTVHLAGDLVDVWRSRRLAEVRPVASTGCPFAAPVVRATVSREPLIGTPSLVIGLSAATPTSMAFLVAELNAPSGSNPSTSASGTCGYVDFGPSYVEFFTFTDIFGSATLLAGLPLDPCLSGIEYAFQWGVLDGGPLLGVLTVSDALVLRIGER